MHCADVGQEDSPRLSGFAISIVASLTQRRISSLDTAGGGQLPLPLAGHREHVSHIPRMAHERVFLWLLLGHVLPTPRFLAQ